MLPSFAMPTPAVSFTVSIIMGCISAYIAKGRGKNPYLWFGLGMIFGLFGVIFAFFIPAKKGRRRPGSQHPTKEQVVTLDITPTLGSFSKESYWYYLDGQNAQQGPMSYDALKRSFFEGKVKTSTYIWNEQLENWQAFSDIFDVTHSTV